MEYEIFTKSGKLRNEGLTIEYKETFNFGSLAKYFKTMMAFANNRGGVIVFGVTDSPRTIKGLDKKSQFYNTDPEKIVKHIKEDMSVILDFEMDIISVGKKELGYIKVEQLKYKPVICKKNEGDVLKEGSIYYRYSGRSELINYAELRNIIEDIKYNERKAIMDNFSAIIKEGPENIQLINTNTGKIQWGKVPVLINEELLTNLKKEVKFIESGKFDETDGDPTLKVIGSLTSSKILKVKEKTNVNMDYPYFTKDIANENNITNYQAQTLIYNLKFYGDPRFHQVIATSSKTKISKYSKLAFDIIKDELGKIKEKDKKIFFDNLSKEFQKRKNN